MITRVPNAVASISAWIAVWAQRRRWRANGVADLFDPPARRGVPAQSPRRQIVEAMLVIARTVCQ